MTIRFVWNKTNALEYFKKHKVSFEMEMDRIENGERRWQTIGMVDRHLVLLVAHTVNHDDDGSQIIEIISARKADPTERKRYEKNY